MRHRDCQTHKVTHVSTAPAIPTPTHREVDGACGVVEYAMISKRAQQEVLELAMEDFTPLFDVTNLAKASMPKRTTEEHIQAAMMLVRDFIARGYVELHFDCLAESTKNYRHSVQLTAEEARTELQDPGNWVYHQRREPDQRWVAIVATPAALKALQAGEFPG